MLTKEQRRKNMQANKSKGSSIEVSLQKELWHRGLRYRKNFGRVTGRPDIVFVSARIAVFCDGEFWHGYDWKHRKNDFKSNREFWIPKIERNMERDKVVSKRLSEAGWKVIRFWESDIICDVSHCASVVEEEFRKRMVK